MAPSSPPATHAADADDDNNVCPVCAADNGHVAMLLCTMENKLLENNVNVSSPVHLLLEIKVLSIQLLGW